MPSAAEPIADTSVTEARRADVRWRMKSDVAPLLAQILAAPGAVIKESTAKIVARHEAAAGAYYVKRYRHDAFAWRPLKYFVKASRARAEWELAAELTRRGIPIVRHVALGERWSARGLLESIVVTEAFDGAPLGEAHFTDGRRVVDFVLRLAAAHVRHTDLHPANLLVSEDEIRLVDLDGICLADDTAPESLARDMLAQLCITTPLPVSDAVRADGREKRKSNLLGRSRRCLKTNRDFFVERHGGRDWHIRLDACTDALRGLMADPDAFLARARVLKAGRSSTVGAGGGLVLKRFNFRRWLKPLKDFFRETRAQAAFRKAYHLELCGIATARPIAAANERCCGLVHRGFVVTAEVPGAVDLPHWSGEVPPLARALGRLIGRLHEEGFSHRDLKETNVLVDASGAPVLVDLEGVKFEHDVSAATAAANLRRLAEGVAGCGKLSRTAAVAFLLAYSRERTIRPRALFAR